MKKPALPVCGLILLFILCTAPARSQYEADIFGYFEPQYLGAVINEEYIQLQSNKLRIDLEANAWDKVTFTANFDFITYHGKTTWNILDYLPEDITAIIPPQFRDFYAFPFENRIFLDNAYLKFALKHFDITVGRQQISLGSAYVWNPTDMFNTKDVLDPTYEQPGHNAIRVDIPMGSRAGMTALYGVEDDWKGSSKLFQFKGGISRFDFILMAAEKMWTFHDYTGFDSITSYFLGNPEKRQMLGGSLAGDLFGMGIWAEYAFSNMESSGDFYEFSAGIDYTFDFQTYFLLEYYRNTRARKDKEDYTFNDWMRFIAAEQKALSRDQVYGIVQHPVTDLAYLGVSGIYCISDKSFALVTTTSIEEARVLAEQVKDVPSISMVASISDYVPSPQQQAARIPFLESIRSDLEKKRQVEPVNEENFDQLVYELERLEMNVYELGQLAYVEGQDRIDRKCKTLIGDPEDSLSTIYILDLVDRFLGDPNTVQEALNRFQQDYEPVLRDLAYKMAGTSEITTEVLPMDIRNQFLNETGDRYLMTIIPKENVWNFEFLTQFTEQMWRISPKITGTPPMIVALINYLARDGKLATLLTLVVVFLLLLIDFRKVRTVLITMIPLIIGAVWMVGLLNTIGKQLTLLNVMGIPMIIGIGIDFGVHFMHRYRHEGRGQIRTVVASTGKAIMITSLTTMVGFGSLLLAKYRGLGSMGLLLVLGVGSCFITTVYLLPAILGLIEKRKGK